MAARNILLTHELRAKVADFGMASRIDNNQLSGANQNTFPFRWSAFEILQTRVAIKEKSDVWSFGILMWEIFYLGEALPYPNITGIQYITTHYDYLDHSGLPELIDYLGTGQRLEKPPLCPKSLHDLMMWCWKQLYQLRPTFSEIKRELTQFQSKQSVAQINPVQEQSDPKYSDEKILDSASQDDGQNF